MLIGCHGKKQSGKDTFFQRASEINRYAFPVERISYADKLYQSAAAALGVSVEQLMAWKTDPDVFVQVVRNPSPGDPSAALLLQQISVRQYLQNYGTEAHRDIFGDDFWVYHAMPDLDHRGRLCVVTDVRFENEAQRVRELGGVVVKMIGPPEVENAEDTHASEVPLPPKLIDVYVDNSEREFAFGTRGDAEANYSHLDNQIVEIVRELREQETGLNLRGLHL